MRAPSRHADVRHRGGVELCLVVCAALGLGGERPGRRAGGQRLDRRVRQGQSGGEARCGPRRGHACLRVAGGCGDLAGDCPHGRGQGALGVAPGIPDSLVGLGDVVAHDLRPYVRHRPRGDDREIRHTLLPDPRLDPHLRDLVHPAGAHDAPRRGEVPHRRRDADADHHLPVGVVDRLLALADVVGPQDPGRLGLGRAAAPRGGRKGDRPPAVSANILPDWPRGHVHALAHSVGALPRPARQVGPPPHQRRHVSRRGLHRRVLGDPRLHNAHSDLQLLRHLPDRRRLLRGRRVVRRHARGRGERGGERHVRRHRRAVVRGPRGGRRVRAGRPLRRVAQGAAVPRA
mmetsp:Transcript_111954/g.321674  ORF Transcript_111954/g.321674 Transcript_111954/m.321674 type:complete len:345 (+) Transcript_111954:1270-2304(+)